MTVRVHIERDGPRVVLAMRSEGGAAIATLDLHRRGASAFAAVLAAQADSDDDGDAELAINGTLETQNGT